MASHRNEGLQVATVKFGADYQSYADGAVSYSHDLTDNRMDRSYLLKGQVVVTVGNQGQRLWSYVYGNGELLASHTDQWVMPVQWRQVAPSGSGEWRTYPGFGSDGAVERIELDPMRADVGSDNPYTGGGESPNSEHNGDLTSRLADAADFSRCNLDGIRMPCAIVLKNSDAVERARPAVVTLRFRNQNNPSEVS